MTPEAQRRRGRLPRARTILIAAATVYVWTLLAAVGLLPHGSARTSNALAYEYSTTITTGSTTSSSSTTSSTSSARKVTMCHRTARSRQTITVDESAVSAHQQHGDTLGPCP